MHVKSIFLFKWEGRIFAFTLSHGYHIVDKEAIVGDLGQRVLNTQSGLVKGKGTVEVERKWFYRRLIEKGLNERIFKISVEREEVEWSKAKVKNIDYCIYNERCGFVEVKKDYIVFKYYFSNGFVDFRELCRVAERLYKIEVGAGYFRWIDEVELNDELIEKNFFIYDIKY